MNYRNKKVRIKNIELVWSRTLKETFQRLLNKFPSKEKHVNCTLKHSCNCYKTILKAIFIPTCVKLSIRLISAPLKAATNERKNWFSMDECWIIVFSFTTFVSCSKMCFWTRICWKRGKTFSRDYSIREYLTLLVWYIWSKLYERFSEKQKKHT